MGQKYYGHTVSEGMAGIINDIKIEPSARSENGKPLSYPVKSLSSDINISQPASDVNGNVAQVPTKIFITRQRKHRDSFILPRCAVNIFDLQKAFK